jgi:hypothetical protein
MNSEALQKNQNYQILLLNFNVKTDNTGRKKIPQNGLQMCKLKKIQVILEEAIQN